MRKHTGWSLRPTRKDNAEALFRALANAPMPECRAKNAYGLVCRLAREHKNGHTYIGFDEKSVIV